MICPHYQAALTLAAIIACAPACGRPETDVVSTNTEDVGNYSVTAEQDGAAVHATVCISNPSHADRIADRVLRQLYGRGLQAIDIDMYSASRSIERVTWSSGVRRTEKLAGAPPGGSCADHSTKEHS